MELPVVEEAQTPMMYHEANSEKWELVQRKLTNPNAKFTIEESLSSMMCCIHMGEEAASKAEGKDIIMVVGNTGAGKSTFINIIAGCEMKQFYKPNTKTRVSFVPSTHTYHIINIGGVMHWRLNSLIQLPVSHPIVPMQVWAVAEDSEIKAIMKIGHTNQSMTFVPDVGSDDTFT